MNYQIDKGAWHYRLWHYLTSASFVPVGFTNGGHIPRDLCTYINRLIIYFLFQVPLMWLVGTFLAFALIMNPIVMGVIMIMYPSEVWAINEPRWTMTLVVYFLYAFVGCSFALFAFKEWRLRRWRENPDRYKEREPSKFAVAAGRAGHLAVSPFRILWDWAVAMHNKVCLKLEFQE